jgi:hypothetical protein
MHRITRLMAPVLLVLMTGCSSTTPITYDGAIKENAQRPDAVPAQEWANSVLGSFWNAQMPGLLESCFHPSVQDSRVQARLVVQLDRDRVTVPFRQGTPNSFSECLSSSVKALNWPKSPFSKIYFAVEVNTQPPDSSSDEAAAKAFLDSVSRSNKSPERTREK